MIVLLAAAFALKAVVLSQLRHHPLLAPDAGLDTTAYVQLARQVLAGNVGLGPGLYYVSPFYIYFLATILAVLRSFTAVRVVQIVLGTASVGLIYLMARRWFGQRAGFIAAVLAAATGLFTFYEVLLLQSSVDVFFTAAALYLFLPPDTRDRPPEGGSYPGRGGALVASGIVWGVQTLNRPNVMIAVLGIALLMLIVLRRVRPAVLLVAGLLVGLAPVAVRNVLVAHEWTLVSSHGGLNFYIGNNAEATGFYRPVPGVRPAIAGQAIDTRRIAEKALGRPVSDADASSYFFDLGLTWIRQHPLDAAGLFLKKLAFAFHASHVPLPQSYAFFAYDTPGILRFLVVGPWLLSPLGFIGAAMLLSKLSGSRAPSGSTRSEFTIWFGFVPAYAASVALFFVADRYRLPLMVPLCVCAGGAIDGAISGLATHGVRGLVAPGIGFATLLVAVKYPVALDDGRWTEGLRTAERLVISQRYDEAERWADWLEAHHPPHPGAGQLGVAQQLMAIDQHARALPYLERAVQADPNEPHANYALGQTLLQLGRASEAVPRLRHGFDAGIDLPGGGEDYARALLQSGDARGAAAALQRIRPAASAEAEAWLRLGRLGMESRAPEVAEPFFEHATQMQPGDSAARQQYGLNLLVLNRLDDAARELTEAVRLDPGNADSLSRLAYAEAKLGRTNDARRHVAAALAIDPHDPLSRQLAAVLR